MTPFSIRCVPSIAGVLLAAFLASCRAVPERLGAKPSIVLTYTSPMWYEETTRYFQVSPDGRLALYGPGSRSRVYDLRERREVPAGGGDGRIRLSGGTFGPTGAVVPLASRDERPTAWFAGRGGELTPLDVPAAAIPRWAPNGSGFAYFTPGESTITLGETNARTVVRCDGAVTGLSWTPAGDALYATVLHPDGLTSLVKITPDGSLLHVRGQLDASPFFNSLAFAADGRTLFLALASDGVPDPSARHDPEAQRRDLDIYALDLGSGQLHDVVLTPGDDCCPYVAGGILYWTHNDPQAQVVVFPLSGGDPHAVADHGFLPRWSPDGRQIAFTRGYYRLADYGLDMDAWVVGVDSTGAVTSAAKPWITGFGEDMGAAWSPDGHWVAYHSHRSATAVPLYESAGRTDDTWLMSVSGGPEIRLTDFGFEVGPPDWAPDSRHVIFDSWDRNGAPRFAKPWIVTIDPTSGRPRSAARMPLPSGVAGITGEAWSPVGNDIAFVERLDDRRRALWVEHPDGGDPHRLAELSSYTIGGVTWTPDGRQILYGALDGDRMQIFAIARTGGVPRQLTHGDVNMMHPSVSPDGTLVAASRIPWRKELWRMLLP